MIKTRTAKISRRGIYIQDKELQQTRFKPGTKYTYVLDPKKRTIIILASEDMGNTVSKRNETNAVIDIRKKECIELFQDYDYLQIEIHNDQIVVTGIVKETNETKRVVFSYQELLREQLDIFDFLTIDKPSFAIPIKNHLQETHRALDVVSLFSGAGLLDQGFIEEGFNIVYALEKNEDACRTYRHNIGQHVHCEDILNVDLSTLPKAPVMIAGCPCQGLTNSNRYTNFLDNPNNLLVKKYIEGVEKNSACEIFMIENVPQIITAGNGRFLREIKERLSGFEITYGVLNAASFGSPQERQRAFIIGSKRGKVELPEPLYVKGQYKTVGEAFEDVEGKPNQCDVSKSKAITLELMSHVPPGGNIKSIPQEIRPKGTHSDMYKRLELDKPSITIVNPRKSMLLHPDHNRILSVRECARLFDLSDNFVFKGGLSSMQQQIANSVPVQLARAVAREIKKVMQNFIYRLA